MILFDEDLRVIRLQVEPSPERLQLYLAYGALKKLVELEAARRRVTVAILVLNSVGQEETMVRLDPYDAASLAWELGFLTLVEMTAAELTRKWRQLVAMDTAAAVVF